MLTRLTALQPDRRQNREAGASLTDFMRGGTLARNASNGRWQWRTNLTGLDWAATFCRRHNARDAVTNNDRPRLAENGTASSER